MTAQPASFPALKVDTLQGTEPFRRQGVALDHSVGDFWRWAYSNLAANNLRGHLAEFLVGSDLGVTAKPRVEWADHDLLTKTGTKVEVKSAAYLQSWNQSRCSPISFGVAPTRSFNSVTGKRDGEPARGADVYVFCLLAHKDKPTLDPTNLDQWQFFVIASRKIDVELGAQESISLGRLLKLKPIRCVYGEIDSSIKQALRDGEVP